MLNFFVIFTVASCLASPVTASSIVSKYHLKDLPTCALQCRQYEIAQQRCASSLHIENNHSLDNNCFCDILAQEHSSSICSESCTSEEERQQLNSWLDRICRRAGVRRQDAAAAAPGTDAAAPAPADPNAAAPPAGQGGQDGTGGNNAADPGNQGQGGQGQAGTNNAANTGDQGQGGNGQAPNPNAGSPTEMPTPTDSTSASATSASQSPVHFPEEPHEKPSEWPKKYGRWLAMAIVLVVGFTALTIFLVWLKRHIHKKRAEERALLQEQALEAAAAGSDDGPGMSTNPGAPGLVITGQEPGTHVAVKSDPDPEANPPAVGFSHAPGTRYTAYDHMLAEQQLQEEQQRQKSQSGSARSRISALFGRGPKSPRDMISEEGPAPGLNMPVHESPHELNRDQLSYPAPTDTERSHTPRLRS